MGIGSLKVYKLYKDNRGEENKEIGSIQKGFKALWHCGSKFFKVFL